MVATGRLRSRGSTRVSRPDRPRGPRLVIVVPFMLLVMLSAPLAALAENGQVGLALTPVGQRGSYFDLTMRPGERRSLEVEIANTGDAASTARTYAADVFTIVNGGFGGRLHDDPQTDTTRWLDYPSDVLRLAAGSRFPRAFAVTVPADAGPGQYITSLILENDEPIRNAGGVALIQVVRQAVAVVITVPGKRSPGLAIGQANYKVVAGMAMVAIAVANTGNVRLKPLVTFAVLDAGGAQRSRTNLAMDTFYAHTETFVEVQLETPLLPGTYAVSLSLDDTVQGARAEEAAIVLVVEAPPPGPVAGNGEEPGLNDAIQTALDGGVPLAAWAALLTAGILLVAGFAWLILVRRRRRPPPGRVR